MVPCPTEMSIQPTSVLRRIVEDARAHPFSGFVCDALLPEDFRATGTQQRMTWLRAPIRGFTTEFEFWAHALRVWLERAGVPERFEPIVGNALCEPLARDELNRAIEARLSVAKTRREIDVRGSFAGAYLMIDQDVLESWTISSDTELLAVFWEDLDWL